mgnify:FL=1
MSRHKPILYIVVPCYNEEQVLPHTNPMFVEKIEQLVKKEEIHPHSKIMYVNDGSKDRTWELIESYAKSIPSVVGVSQSRNRGHQSSVLAGMYEAIQFADIVITIDADGQDDINCMDKMVSEYKSGSEIVYGVRDNRDTDSTFKRITAEGFYKVLRLFGAEVVFNHADYRLVSKRFLKELEKFTEVNLFLRGLMPLVGFKYSYVLYKRHERIAGESHYPLSKMLGLAMDGITSLSIKPIRLITSLGVLTSLFSFLLIIWVVWSKLAGTVVAGWASTYAIVSLLGGVQLISLGVIGEYLGKIYLETKRRPRYIISDRTFDTDSVSSDLNP